MSDVETLALIVGFLVTAGVGVAALVRWGRWRGEEQDTRLITGIVDLRRRFREGDVEARLPAKGRGFFRDIETAVNKLLDEASVHLRERRAEATVLAQALDALGGIATRTAEQLGETVGQIEQLGAELERRASIPAGDGPIQDALTHLRAEDEGLADHSRAAAALADTAREATTRCHTALKQLRATLAGLAHEAAATTEGVRTLETQWGEVRTGIQGVARVVGTSEVLAVNAALAVGREHDGQVALGRIASEADEVAHDATRAVARVTAAAAECEGPLARLVGAGDAERRLAVATAEAAELDGAIGRIQDLPSDLAALVGGLTGVANLRGEAVVQLSAARPDIAQLTDELGSWTALARRIGSELSHAAGVLATARREAERLVQKEEAS